MPPFILTRAPLRMTLGGGGTDLPSYYRKYGTSLFAATLNQYVYIILKRRLERNIGLYYSKSEVVDSIDKINHPVFREALRLLEIDKGVEIATVTDVPSRTGLGSSSSFTVALLLALHS